MSCARDAASKNATGLGKQSPAGQSAWLAGQAVVPFGTGSLSIIRGARLGRRGQEEERTAPRYKHARPVAARDRLHPRPRVRLAEADDEDARRTRCTHSAGQHKLRRGVDAQLDSAADPPRDREAGASAAPGAAPQLVRPGAAAQRSSTRLPACPLGQLDDGVQHQGPGGRWERWPGSQQRTRPGDRHLARTHEQPFGPAFGLLALGRGNGGSVIQASNRAHRQLGHPPPQSRVDDRQHPAASPAFTTSPPLTTMRNGRLSATSAGSSRVYSGRFSAVNTRRAPTPPSARSGIFRPARAVMTWPRPQPPAPLTAASWRPFRT